MTWRESLVQHFAIKIALRENKDELDVREAEDILWASAEQAGEVRDWYDISTHEYIESIWEEE